MLYRLLTAGAAVCAFSLLGFTGQADATTRLTLKASPSLTILAQNSENSEVQNLLEPQSDSGVPGGPSQPTPEDQPAAGDKCRPSLRAAAAARRTRSTRKRASSPRRTPRWPRLFRRYPSLPPFSTFVSALSMSA